MPAFFGACAKAAAACKSRHRTNPRRILTRASRKPRTSSSKAAPKKQNKKFSDELAKDPKSVEGYNLLGIIEVSQKEFRRRPRRFPARPQTGSRFPANKNQHWQSLRRATKTRSCRKGISRSPPRRARQRRSKLQSWPNPSRQKPGRRGSPLFRKSRSAHERIPNQFAPRLSSFRPHTPRRFLSQTIFPLEIRTTSSFT